MEGRPHNHGGKILSELGLAATGSGGFRLESTFKPTGDQPSAIAALARGVLEGERAQTLLGVTGSGKTFSIANVVERIQRPTLVLSHNKTLAAQLYQEFKSFFPDNAVEYFVSYYDYYQPEAYIPSSGTYIEKDLSINDEIEKLRLSTTSALLSGRRDVLVVASVSCLYGMGNPEAFKSQQVQVESGQKISRQKFLHSLVQALYSRTEGEFKRGNFRVKGDTVDVFPAYGDIFYRILFWGDEIERIEQWDPVANERQAAMERLRIFPANLFVTTPDMLNGAIKQIELDLGAQVDHFTKMGRPLEAKRLEERTVFDLEMIRELGYCSGIENYSRHLDGRDPGSAPNSNMNLVNSLACIKMKMLPNEVVQASTINAAYAMDVHHTLGSISRGKKANIILTKPLDSISEMFYYFGQSPVDGVILNGKVERSID